MRMRVDPGRACVEAVAAKTSTLYALEAKGAPPGPAKALTAVPGGKGLPAGAAVVPLAVSERASGRRWGLRCAFKPAAKH
jgi:hypothetical protein